MQDRVGGVQESLVKREVALLLGSVRRARRSPSPDAADVEEVLRHERVPGGEQPGQPGVVLQVLAACRW